MDKKGITVKKGERGQSFMELAVSLIFLLILLAAVIDLGWAFYTMTALRDTAQEAASYGTMCPVKGPILQRLTTSTTSPLSKEDIESSIEKGEVSVTFVDAVTGTVLGTETGQHGNLVRVSVQIDHKIMTPFVGSFIGTYTYPLKVDVSDTIMVDDCP